MISIASAKSILQQHESSKVPGRQFMVRAGVGCIMRDDEANGIEILLIQRAKRAGDPWSGDMAFPGGKMDLSDAHIHAAVTREIWEETGVEEDLMLTLGRLSDQMTKTHSGIKPMVITPFVFELGGEPNWKPNYEVADMVWVPISLFQDPSNRDEMTWKLGKLKKKMPCYWFGEYRIWGLTLRMIDELAQILNKRP